MSPIQKSCSLVFIKRTQTPNNTKNGFQSLALFCSTEIIWSHFGTDIIEIEALSNQYCIAAWSIEEAIPGIKGASIFLPALP